jgi:hypothetical protein
MGQQKTRVVRVYEAWPLKGSHWSCPDRLELPDVTTTAVKSVLSTHPFAVPARLNPDLDEIRAYWNSLARGSTSIPFADDLKLGEFRELSNRAFLIDVLRTPERFRFNIVGEQVTRGYGGELAGKFVDEIPARAPLDYFLSQCAATVEAHAPTFYRHAPEKICEYERLIFPLRADAHISALLGAISAPEGE